MDKIFKHLKHPLMYASFVIVVMIAIGSFAYYKLNSQKAVYLYAEVKSGTIVSEVISMGNVKAAQDVDMAFQVSGRVSGVGSDVGQKVVPGQVLAQLDNQDLRAQLAQAQANVKTQQAKLDDLKNGTRPEDLDITQAQLNLNQQDLANTYDTVPNILNDVYNKSDDAVRKQLDQMFLDDETNPQLTFQVNDSQIQIDVVSKRSEMTTMLNEWKNDLSVFDVSSNDAADQEMIEAGNNLNTIQSFLGRMMDAVINQASLQQPQTDSYKINITTARGEITAGLTSVDGLKQKIASQKLVIEQTKKQLELKQAGATADTITAQEAQVEAAQASVQNIQAQISKTYITSPFYGIVAKNDAKVGQVVSPGVPLVSLISASKYQIETYIPEADVAKIVSGDMATVTLDAYGSGVSFNAKVISVEPAETITNGVATYKTVLEFVNDDSRIKSGLTANLSIETGRKDNVLIIPTQAIIRRNQDNFVLVKKDSSEPVEQKVVLGMEGHDNTVEVVSGLSQGDQVVNFGGSN